jgi:hypothetical protein
LRNKSTPLTAILDHLKSLSPSGLELEFLSLSTFDLDAKSEVTNCVSLMLTFFLELTRRKQDTDFIQALLNCFLKTHYDAIMSEDSEDGEMIGKVLQIQQASEEAFHELEAMIDHNQCMVSHFTGIQMQ